jgi:hypothetical protein
MGGGDVSQLEYILSWNFVVSIPEAHLKQAKGQEIYWKEQKDCWKWSNKGRNWEHVRGF